MGHLNVGVWRGFSTIWGLTRKIAGEKRTKLLAGSFELLNSFWDQRISPEKTRLWELNKRLLPVCRLFGNYAAPMKLNCAKQELSARAIVVTMLAATWRFAR